MCGIAGIWGDPRPERLEAMARALRHRGPDDQGLWNSPSEPLGLAHRRLSIIDLEGGRQPVFNESGRILTIFNGEIYNYCELREELIARGHRFSTNTDTEVIVHLYEEMGPDAVQKLRGMFAIAIWDEDQRQLVLARDRVGKKPLYYSQTADEFLFASEIKGIAAGTRVPFDLDHQSLADYLGWGALNAPATIYRQVRSAEPGELLVVRDRQVVHRRKYWRLQMQPKVELTTDEAIEQIDKLIREAVRLRLRSDVPVGAFLSGGIDSGIITAMAAQACPGKLVTVTIGFDDEQFDERPLAKLVAQQYSTDHHEVLIRPNVARDLPRIAAAYDQPFGGASAVPSYYVAEAARRFVKVVLNGDGGDEVFAGYRRYVAARINDLLSWADGPRCRPVWRLLSGLMPMPRGFRTPYAFAHRLLRGLGQEPSQRYLAWTIDAFGAPELAALCGLESAGRRPDTGSDESVGSGVKGARWLEATLPSARLAQQCLAEQSDGGPVDQMLGADFVGILPHDLLVKMDIACMAHGLEARSPLLDHVLAETVARYPSSLKLSGFQTKPLLRRLSRRYVPPAVQTAPKRGFEVPVTRWLRGELRPLCEDIMLSSNGLLAEMFNRAVLERMIREEDRVDPARWGRRMWLLLMLGIWDEYVRPKQPPAGGR